MEEWPFDRPELIMITGDMVDESFIDFVNVTLSEYVGKVIHILSSNATVVAAKGAAEIMRRTLERKDLD